MLNAPDPSLVTLRQQARQAQQRTASNLQRSQVRRPCELLALRSKPCEPKTISLPPNFLVFRSQVSGVSRTASAARRLDIKIREIAGNATAAHIARVVTPSLPRPRQVVAKSRAFWFAPAASFEFIAEAYATIGRPRTSPTASSTSSSSPISVRGVRVEVGGGLLNSAMNAAKRHLTNE